MMTPYTNRMLLADHAYLSSRRDLIRRRLVILAWAVASAGVALGIVQVVLMVLS